MQDFLPGVLTLGEISLVFLGGQFSHAVRKLPISMVGTMAASSVGFSFSRFVARDWVAKIIPAPFEKYDESLARRAFRTVIILPPRCGSRRVSHSPRS